MPPSEAQGRRRVRQRRATSGDWPTVHKHLETANTNEEFLRGLATIIINLERRPDRLVECLERLGQHCPGLRCTRFAATDGRQDTIPTKEVVSTWHTGRNVVYQRIRAVRKGWGDLDTYRSRNLELSAGERGCAKSHIRAWQHCLAAAGSANKPLLVLEDDADPTPDFIATMSRVLPKLPRDAHVLYLGYSQAANWRREICPELVESEYVWTTVGYMVWPAGARLLLSKLPVDQPVDNYMAALNASGDLKAYCVRPKIVLQAEAWNVNSDVAHSDEHYWGPDSDIHHSDALYWGPDKATSEARQKMVSPHCANALFWDVGSEDSEGSTEDL